MAKLTLSLIAEVNKNYFSVQNDSLTRLTVNLREAHDVINATQNNCILFNYV